MMAGVASGTTKMGMGDQLITLDHDGQTTQNLHDQQHFRKTGPNVNGGFHAVIKVVTTMWVNNVAPTSKIKQGDKCKHTHKHFISR